jgi:hypothetical protein
MAVAAIKTSQETNRSQINKKKNMSGLLSAKSQLSLPLMDPLMWSQWWARTRGGTDPALMGREAGWHRVEGTKRKGSRSSAAGERV